tara:strand:- start:1100 stop:2329 length:1230 start_codon:yes stop_codon:yes gene_type:complete
MKSHFKLRPYQLEISEKAVNILNKNKIVYLSMEVRTGKTLTALNIANLYKAKNVLFLTKKKAIKSILDDYSNFNFTFDITVLNDESIHKLGLDFDFVIHDEHHRFGAFPKPNKSAKIFKQKYSNLPMVFLSGTPFPESYSQVFHQFWVSNYSPFKENNFYKWAKIYVNVKFKYLGYANVNDYSEANYDKIKPIIDKYLVTFTQKQAGFETNVNENILYCDMNSLTYDLCEKLKNDLVIEGKNEVVLADTSVKLQSKLHQLYSGTVKFESGKRKVLDYSKAEFIKERFKNNKIGIFYKFKAEYDALKEIYKDNLTDNLEEFNTSDKNIALQIVSGREGISLRNADYLVYYNIDFSAVSYWQSRDRLTTMERKNNDIFWVFSRNGIEEKIYKSVQNKKDYNLKIFKQDYGI